MKEDLGEGRRGESDLYKLWTLASPLLPMSESQDVDSLWIYSPNGSICCRLSEENEEDSLCEEDDSHATESPASSGQEGSPSSHSTTDKSEDSVTSVTEDTTPSELEYIYSLTSRATHYNYFVPEKYTKAKVRTFKKSSEKKFKIEASSAINRRKKQCEIDRENLILLRKLKEVKPSVYMAK